MKKSRVEPDHITFNSLITACSKTQSLSTGKKLHELVKLSNIDDMKLSTTIMNFYNKCGQAGRAFEIFSNTAKKDIVSWNCAMESIIALHGTDRSLTFLDEMQQSGVTPNSFTFSTILTACAEKQSLSIGKKVHELAKLHNIESIELSNTIIDFYNKCGQPEVALDVFKELQKKGKAGVISWNCAIESMIALNGIEHAMNYLDGMKNCGIEADTVTFTTLFYACSKTKSLEIGKKLHEVVKLGNIESVQLSTTIMNFYTKCGQPELALALFKELQENGKTEVITWNCAIGATIELYGIDHAIELFHKMKQSDIIPDSFTFNILISACADSVSIIQGKALIEEIRDSNFEEDEIVKSVRIMFYASIGEIDMSISVFEEMIDSGKYLDTITWNNMLSAFSSHGGGKESFLLFQRMVDSNVRPNEQTYTTVLTGLSHAGMVNEAVDFYSKIKNPSQYHRVTMIDVFARAGRMDEAENMISESKDMMGYMTLMGACRKHNDVKCAERIFEN